MHVGVLGGGQLSQMIAHAGHPLGIDVSSYDPSPDGPASYGGTIIEGAFTDLDRVRDWARECDVVTYEWENVPVELVSDIAGFRPVRPGPNALAVMQDRWHEKRLLSELQIPIAPFRLCSNIDDLRRAVMEIGPDVVAKTRTGGYDGKGQAVIKGDDSIDAAAALLDHGDVVVEQFVPFDFEASVIAVRSTQGEVVTYPTTLNVHREGILRTSIVDTGLSHHQSNEAADFVSKILQKLEYVGVMALELFSAGGRLMGNEIAPRVHNSGHWTIEGAETSQFDNHLRAVCGLPLGSTAARCHAAMVNIIGTPPDALGILGVPGASMHTYRKTPRPGRKLGHVTITADDDRTLLERIDAVEKFLTN